MVGNCGMVWNVWVMPGNVKDLMFSWNCRRRSRAGSVAPLALMWVLSRERRAFEGVGMNLVKLRSSHLSLFPFDAFMSSLVVKIIGYLW